MESTVTRTGFGVLPDGRAVELFTLSNRHGLVVRITNYGTIITHLEVPDRKGRKGDIVLGFDNLEQYVKGHPFFGCTVGRVANRIAEGRFSLRGKTLQLAVNNGPNHLHGGVKGFDKVVWAARPLAGPGVEFSYLSPDGDENYPGNLDVSVCMALNDANELRIDYKAVTDRPTVVNLTNHSYFNLAEAGDVLDHELCIAASAYTPSDANLIPTGEIAPVTGTPLDFTQPKRIGSRFAELPGDPKGYDHNYVLDSGGGRLVLAARVFEPTTGRVMATLTTLPGLQLYTANFLDGSITGKYGNIYRRHSGLCLETQFFPDAVHHPHFPSIELNPGETYKQTTVYRFGTV